MQYSELVTDGDAFSALRAQCNAVFDTSQRLPAQVFLKPFAAYHAFEHGQILRPQFATFLTDLARCFDDRTVNYMTLEPDPVTYYHKNCGFYGLASFRPENLTKNYTQVMSRDGHADSFRARGGDVGVLWGSSLKWGIFCDRRSWELCLMGSSVLPDESIIAATGPMDKQQLQAYVTNQYREQQLAKAIGFMGMIANNYPGLG